MINFLRTLIYNKKEFIIISLIQFLFGISELLFSLIAGYSISTFLVNEKITLYNYELNNTTIFSLLIFSILLRSYLSYLASKVSSTSIYKLWDLIIQKAFFVIRNGHININQISSFVSLIQLNSYVGLNNFFYTLYQIIGDLLLIVFGVLLLAYANITATIYTFILITIFYFTFIKNVINFSKVTGKNQKFFLDKTVSLFRNLIAFRDLNWVRNKEFDAYDLINENSESLKKYSKRHLILDNVTRVIIESFGIVVLISYPLFSLVTSKGSISSEEFIITITLWAKLFITFYRASSRYNTITFNYTYAKSVVKFISEYETIENYQNKGYSRLDSFNEKVTLNNKKEILHVKAFKTENKKGPNFEFPEISILRGEKYTLIGQSGSGKSSLIKTILQLPSFNYLVGNIDFDLNTTKVSYISTEHELGFGRITDLINFSRSIDFETKVIDLIKKLNLTSKIENIESLKNINLESLSSGQKMRMRFLTELLFEPDLIIVDESFSSLDKRTLKNCINAIDKNTSLLVIDHSSNLKDLINYEIKEI